jgi:hypothetical protein
MAKTSPNKRDPKAKRGPHKAIPITEQELAKVAELLKEMSHRLRALANSVGMSEHRVAHLKSWTTFAEAVTAAMKISGKFAADFEVQSVADVTGFRMIADETDQG